MRLQKIFLLTSICTATLVTTNLYAAETIPIHSLSNQESYGVKSIIISNLDSLFPFQTQITIGKVNRDSQGNIVASDILIISEGLQNPNISINKLTLVGLNINSQVNKDFVIKVAGLSIANLAPSIANSNIISSKTSAKKLSSNNDLFSIILNTLGQGIYNFQFKYNHSDNVVTFKLDSTVEKKEFFKENIEFKDVDFAGINVDMDFLASLQECLMNSEIKQLDFDANFSEIIKKVIAEYLGKEYKKTLYLDVNGNLGKVPGQLDINVNGKLGSESYLKYSSITEGVDFEGTKIKEISNGSNKVLKSAYIKSSSIDSKLMLNFNINSFPEGSPIRQVFSILNKKNINIAVASDHSYKGSDYTTDLDIEMDNLASLTSSTKAKVDGKLDLLPYMGVGAEDQQNLYNCTNQLCLTDINIGFVNHGLLEKIARYINKDPNTTSQQILGSYGALLQLFAVQQQDKFLQQLLSSFAMFLQNPKNISINIRAYKPVNEVSLLNMIFNDVKILKRHSPIKNNGNVDLSKEVNIKLINDIQNIFKISFVVNK